jgi:hypothetical protein
MKHPRLKFPVDPELEGPLMRFRVFREVATYDAHTKTWRDLGAVVLEEATVIYRNGTFQVFSNQPLKPLNSPRGHARGHSA